MDSGLSNSVHLILFLSVYVYARNLNAIFLFVILSRLILNPLLIAPPRVWHPPSRPQTFSYYYLFPFSYRFEERIINRGSSFNYFFKVDPGSRVNLLSNYFYTVQPGREIKCRENQIRNLVLKILKIVLCYCRVSIILCDLMITQEIDF